MIVGSVGHFELGSVVIIRCVESSDFYLVGAWIFWLYRIFWLSAGLT